MPTIWELYPDLTRAIEADHIEAGMTGSHNFDHALRVGQMAYTLTMTETPAYAEQAGVAGLLHNTDRILERELEIGFQNVSAVPDKAVETHARDFLFGYTRFSDSDQGLIIEAVLNHGSKPNHPNDHIVSVALADADRLINMEPDAIIRSGQNHPENPALDPVYMEATPGANYRDMKTVFWDLANTAGWMREEGSYIIRLPQARRLGRERADYLLEFIEITKRQRRELGLWPYPKPLISK